MTQKKMKKKMERKLMKGAPRKAIMDLVNKSIDESSISSEASAWR